MVLPDGSRRVRSKYVAQRYDARSRWLIVATKWETTRCLRRIDVYALGH